jgi:transcriptional regulator with XRE-family HTH domain/quercetin dioxygenase-like cupin family protein
MPDINPQHARAIGEKLRAIRQERGMSLRELANKAEMSASMLSQIETGKTFPSVRSIYNIAAALAVSVDYFFPEQVGNDGASSNGSNGRTAGEMTASEMRRAKVDQAPANDATEFPARAPSLSPVIQPGARPMIELQGGVTWARLTAFGESDAEFLEITYSPGAMSGANRSHHKGREFGLVLEGELVIELGFESYTLQAGDSIIFESTQPHRLINKGTQTMRAVWVVLNQP